MKSENRANYRVQFFHCSAVKLPSEDAIFCGIVPVFGGTTTLLTHARMESSCLSEMIPPNIHTSLRFFAVPRKRLCMGSMMVNLIRLKQFSTNKMEYLTPVIVSSAFCCEIQVASLISLHLLTMSDDISRGPIIPSKTRVVFPSNLTRKVLQAS